MSDLKNLFIVTLFFLMLSIGTMAQPIISTPLPNTPSAVATTAYPFTPEQTNKFINDLMDVVITFGIPLGLWWMRNHQKVMQDVGMNQAMTNQAARLGAVLLDILQKQGIGTADIDVSSPIVTSLATTLRENYPDFSKALNMTQEKAGNYILSEAKKQDPTIAMSQSSAPQPAENVKVVSLPTSTPNVVATLA